MIHNTGNKTADVLLIAGGSIFGYWGIEAKIDLYYILGCISLCILIGKNVWEWREKIIEKQKKQKQKNEQNN